MASSETPTEAAARAFVKSYSNTERLTPLRTKQLLKAALGTEKPVPPANDVCRLRLQQSADQRSD